MVSLCIEESTIFARRCVDIVIQDFVALFALLVDTDMHCLLACYLDPAHALACSFVCFCRQEAGPEGGARHPGIWGAAVDACCCCLDSS